MYCLEQPDTILKFNVLECRFVPKEVGVRVKFSLNLYRADSKFGLVECQVSCFSYKSKIKLVKYQPFCSNLWQN